MLVNKKLRIEWDNKKHPQRGAQGSIQIGTISLVYEKIFFVIFFPNPTIELTI